MLGEWERGPTRPPTLSPCRFYFFSRLHWVNIFLLPVHSICIPRLTCSQSLGMESLPHEAPSLEPISLWFSATGNHLFFSSSLCWLSAYPSRSHKGYWDGGGINMKKPLWSLCPRVPVHEVRVGLSIQTNVACCTCPRREYCAEYRTWITVLSWLWRSWAQWKLAADPFQVCPGLSHALLSAWRWAPAC